jgi:antidote-toxin recognition MazE-like antitoxin
MASESRPKKVRKHRERLRSIQLWVPDVGAPAFRSAAHRQSLAAAASSHGCDDQAFIDSVSAFNDEADGNVS